MCGAARRRQQNALSAALVCGGGSSAAQSLSLHAARLPAWGLYGCILLLCLPFYVQLFESVQYKVCVKRLEDFPNLCKGSVQNWPLPVTKLDAAATQYKQFNYHRACLPAFTATCKIHVFFVAFFIEERQQNAVTFFLERHRRPLFAFLVCIKHLLQLVHCLLLKKCIVFKRIFGQEKMIIKFIFCLQPSVISLCENTVEWSLSVSFNRNSQLHLSVLEVKGEPGTY